MIHGRTVCQYMARRAEIPPFSLSRGWYRNTVLSIYTGAQKPFIFRAVGFVAIRAGKNVVFATVPVGRKGITHAAVVMAPSVLISAGPPLNVR